MYIGATNEFPGGVAGLFFAAEIQALGCWDNTLTAPQMLAVATAMAAL